MKQHNFPFCKNVCTVLKTFFVAVVQMTSLTSSGWVRLFNSHSVDFGKLNLVWSEINKLLQPILKHDISSNMAFVLM